MGSPLASGHALKKRVLTDVEPARLQKSAMSVCLVLAMLLVIGFARNDPRQDNNRLGPPLDALLLRRSEQRIDALQIENDLLKKRFRNGTATRLLSSSPPLARQRPPKSDAPSTTRLRRRAVVEAFRHAWSAYRRHAWGHDELKPRLEIVQRGVLSRLDDH